MEGAEKRRISKIIVCPTFLRTQGQLFQRMLAFVDFCGWVWDAECPNGHTQENRIQGFGMV